MKLPFASLLAFPVFVWAVHLLAILPALESLSGDAKFIVAMRFFLVAACGMIACSGVAAGMLLRYRRPEFLLPLLLNYSWVYYVKVLLWGTTFGNL